ncbi:MAG: metallophosphoesterase [Methanomicrobiales archaeon]|nr:metallophosphoesterase [Methanomicrobiales archaeon]
MIGNTLLQECGFLHNCLFLRSDRVLIAADVHIGMEEELHCQGLHFPLNEEETLLARFGEAIEFFRPQRIILDGDIMHSFATIPRRVREKFRRILSTITEYAEVTLIRGSHDRLLPYITGTSTAESVVIGQWHIAHGDRDLDRDRSLIIGHEHPVLELDMAREPCFLFGERVCDRHDLLILPAFNPLCQGVVVNSLRCGELLAPMLRSIDPADLQPVVEHAGEVFLFPPLGKIQACSPALH